MRRALALLGAVVVLSAAGVAVPAAACACGGAAPPDGAEVRVDHEVAIVRWNGTREEIVMRLGMTGDTGDTGLVVPTPAPATVDLGDAALFEALKRELEPVVITEWDWWGGFGARRRQRGRCARRHGRTRPGATRSDPGHDARVRRSRGAQRLARHERLRAAGRGRRPARPVHRGRLGVRGPEAHVRRAVRRRARPDPVHVRLRRARVPRCGCPPRPRPRSRCGSTCRPTIARRWPAARPSRMSCTPVFPRSRRSRRSAAT